MMGARQLFYLTNEGLITFVFSRGQLQQRQEFLTETDGLQRFAEHLNQSPSAKLPASLFVDLFDEDFRLDTVPHLRGSDAQAVLNRRLSQLFRATPYRNSINQGREVDGRRDDKMLYHAITNAEVIDPWLDVMHDALVPLTQISSTAVASQRMLKELNLTAQHILLLTFVPFVGLRQTYFRDQQLKFSRLTPLPISGYQGGYQGARDTNNGAQTDVTLGALVDAESMRTWQYLDSLRFFNADSVLDINVIANSAEKAALASGFVPMPMVKHRVFEIGPLALKLGLNAPSTTPGNGYNRASTEEVLLTLFAKHGATNHFATPALREHARTRTAKGALTAATLGVLTIGAAVAGWLYIQSINIRNQTDLQAAQISQLAADYQRALSQTAEQATASGSSTAADTVRDAAQFYLGHIAPVATPTAMLVEVSEVLLAVPEVALAQVVWAVVADTKTPLNFTPLVTNFGDVKSVIATDPARAAAARTQAVAPVGGSTAAPLAAHKAQAAIFEATLTRFNGDYGRANAVAESIVATLNARGVVEAKLHVAPLEAAAKATISAGNIGGGSNSEYADARFEIRVVQKTAPQTQSKGDIKP